MSEPITEPTETPVPNGAPDDVSEIHTPADPVEDDSSSDVTEPDADDQGDGKGRSDAAKYRARLREAAAERDALRDQLAAQRRAIVDWRANSAAVSVDPALLDAAGIDVDTLLDENGHLDMSAVDEFIGATAKRFNLAQGFRPNRAQGTSGAPAAPPSLADAFRPRLGGKMLTSWTSEQRGARRHSNWLASVHALGNSRRCGPCLL